MFIAMRKFVLPVTIITLLSIVGALSQNDSNTIRGCPNNDYESVSCLPCQKRTCANRNLKLQPCGNVCKPGCQCKPGLLELTPGVCVPEDQCSQSSMTSTTTDTSTTSTVTITKPTCTGNTSLSDCLNPCFNRSCANLIVNKNRVCALFCLIGCDCADGFRSDINGVCIPEEQCPQWSQVSTTTSPTTTTTTTTKCPKGYEFRTHISPCTARTCQNLLPITHSCPAIYHDGCDCKPGLREIKPGCCIPEQDCPQWSQVLTTTTTPTTTTEVTFTKPICTGNTSLSFLLNPCFNRTCANLIVIKDRLCPASVAVGCDCADGFRSDINGVCIPEKQCPQWSQVLTTTTTPTTTTEVTFTDPICTGNTSLSKCLNPCFDRTCANLIAKKNRICPESCGIGCDCADGFRSDINGVCIPEKQCPQWSQVSSTVRPHQT